jgi:hypothetical protein
VLVHYSTIIKRDFHISRNLSITGEEGFEPSTEAARNQAAYG